MHKSLITAHALLLPSCPTYEPSHSQNEVFYKVPAFPVSTGWASPSPIIHMFRRPVSMLKLSGLLHFYYRKHTKPPSIYVQNRNVPCQQGVRKTTSMISLEKVSQSKPNHGPRPRLTLVKTPRAPHPRLIELARILARRAAQEAFATTSCDTLVH